MVERDIIVCLRLTEAEYRHIREKADQDAETRRKDGTRNLSAYMRNRVLQESGFRGDAGVERELRQLSYQVRKIGVNINQATKKINSGHWNRDVALALQEELAQVGRHMEEMKRLLKEGRGGNHENPEH